MWGSGVTAVMVALEFLEVGMNTVNKAAMSQGLSQFILVFYSNVIGIFLLLSTSFFFYRKRTIPPLTSSIICRIFVLGLLGCCGQVLTYIGIGYSSPTLASAMTDLTPAFTFILAILSRMETLNLRIKSSQAKSIGTLVLITGGLLVTLYKGLPIIGNNKYSNELHILLPSNWVIGGFFLAAHSLILALIFIVQTWTIRDYPAELIVTLISCIFVTFLSALVTLIVEKDPNAWRVNPGIELIAIGYSAAFAVVLRTVVHTWACHMKGPVYASMFKPFGMVIAVFMGVSFLGDTLYLGSLVGAGIIAVGFYSVLWGKAQEEMEMVVEDDKKTCSCGSLFTNKVPFLQNKNIDV